LKNELKANGPISVCVPLAPSNACARARPGAHDELCAAAVVPGGGAPVVATDSGEGKRRRDALARRQWRAAQGQL
jgi:hypothetical protein